MIKIPAKVLIVDDEKDFVEMFSLRLEGEGEQVSTAFDGIEAIGVLEQKAIDVVILDIRMPGIDGIETLRRIKLLHPLVEVIMLTGHGTTETAVEGMKLGAFDYLMKPADFQEINRKIQNALKRKDEQEERIRQAEAKLLVRRSGDV